MASTSKGKGAVKTRSWNKHMKPEGKRMAAKDVRRDGKKQIKEDGEKEAKKKKLNESKVISKFITALSVKNYALANKYLKVVVEDKIKRRIESSLNQPLF